MKKILLFLSLLIFNLFAVANYSLLIGEVRYVNHSGSNTPPYLTWETAADSIMSAVNISSFGDTIYVANGVYEEQVVMIPGLSLIGAGMDSCVIDTRQLIISTHDISIQVADSCLFTGFQINVANNSTLGLGIAGGGSENCIIKENKVITAKYAIFIDATYFVNADITVYNNILANVDIGIELFNSNSLIRKNIIYTDPNSTAAIVAGIYIGAFDYTYKPLIDSNLIYTTHAYGIYQGYGAKPTISNNMFILNEGDGMFLGYSDTILVYNNLIFGDGWGIYNTTAQYLKIFNNYIGGNIAKGIVAGTNDTLLNNVIANAEVGIEKVFNQSPPTVKYNCLWDDSIKYSGFSNNDTTNIYEYPLVVNDDSTQGDLDFHLQAFSPLIDRGDPAILDLDGTRSDIGLYGGPFGEKYSYRDLPPRAPVNLSATVDTDYILLKWERNYEADFNHYNLYQDTTENFTADSTTFVASVEDTFYLHIRPEDIENLYFKLTASDNQGNISEPSEELHIVLTRIKNNEEFIINNYKLFQNYPNPFNPSTKIGYRLKERGYVKLYVYDIKGELVQILVNQYQEGGYHEVEFTGKSRSSDNSSIAMELASGIYICQIMVSNEHNIPVFTDIKKMVYLK